MGQKGPRRNPLPRGNLVLHDLDKPTAQRNRPFHGLQVRRSEIVHFEQLELRVQAAQRVVEGVLEALLRMATLHVCSGAAVGRAPIVLNDGQNRA